MIGLSWASARSAGPPLNHARKGQYKLVSDRYGAPTPKMPPNGLLRSKRQKTLPSIAGQALPPRHELTRLRVDKRRCGRRAIRRARSGGPRDPLMPKEANMRQIDPGIQNRSGGPGHNALPLTRAEERPTLT